MLIRPQHSSASPPTLKIPLRSLGERLPVPCFPDSAQLFAQPEGRAGSLLSLRAMGQELRPLPFSPQSPVLALGSPDGPTSPEKRKGGRQHLGWERGKQASIWQPGGQAEPLGQEKGSQRAEPSWKRAPGHIPSSWHKVFIPARSGSEYSELCHPSVPSSPTGRGCGLVCSQTTCNGWFYPQV